MQQGISFIKIVVSDKGHTLGGFDELGVPGVRGPTGFRVRRDRSRTTEVDLVASAVVRPCCRSCRLTRRSWRSASFEAKLWYLSSMMKVLSVVRQVLPVLA